MKRLALCVAIMLAIISSCLASLYMLKAATDELYTKIDLCLVAYYTEDDTLLDNLEDLENYWGEYYVKASFLTRSSSLDDISGMISRLEPLLNEQGDEFSAELNSIRFRANLLYESQIPHFRSVF